MSGKERIDVLMVERGLVESRSQAQRLIMAGQVRLEGQMVHKASETAENSAHIEVLGLPKFVSRGGEKLQAVLDAFEIDPTNWVCADVGASTGGFTDCLLQAGAKRVYAIDVGKGQLHWRLRKDPRVILLENTNARYLTELPELVELVVADVSFISLTLILPGMRNWLKPEGKVVCLIKPQFEAGKEQVGKGGVVRDRGVHAQVLRKVLASAQAEQLYPVGLIQSPLKGPKGNLEFLVYLIREPSGGSIDTLIANVMASVPSDDG